MFVVKFGIVIALCFLVAASFSQISQGEPHKSQNGGAKGGAYVSQGGVYESQRDTQESQAGAHELQGVPQEMQKRVRRQASQAVVDWVTCDFTAPTKTSCHNCNTRVICKHIGGILKRCSPKKPFCNNGVCSVIASAECT